MSTPTQDVPATSQQHHSDAAFSPTASSPGRSFLLPSPLITKRTRTRSMCELALERPIERGKIHYFCRVKGHGFIKPDNGDSDIFVHVSDIEGEYVPLVGDEVTYRLVPVPPKNEKFQAVHVQITNFTPQVHQRWESPLTKEEEREGSRPSSPHKME